MAEKKQVKEGFTLGLALLDAVPCIAFGVDMVMLSKPLQSTVFLIGAIVAFIAGCLMVVYKLCLAVANKEYPICKKMMPICMSIGWILMIAGAIIKRSNIHIADIWASVSSAPACIFFILGIVCLAGFLIYFKTKFNADSAKDNWIEEIFNAGTQVFMMIGVILAIG